MAVALNVGTLAEPITKAQYLASTKRTPPKLFSHNDQQSYWQSGGAEGMPNGWGGRIADMVLSSNTQQVLTSINLASDSIFPVGRTAVQYSTSPSGPVLLRSRNELYNADGAALLKKLIMGDISGNHMFQSALTVKGRRAIEVTDYLLPKLAAAPKTSTPFPPGNPELLDVGAQLQMVAKLISVNQQLGVKRQVFFVLANGFDTHANVLTDHSKAIGVVANALRAFYDTTVELGVSNQVTTFTASDFGRTLSGNNNAGSDHGWGSMHFVIGGAVKGQKFYGINPTWANNGPDDIGQGRLIPTMSVDQYAATMATWFGLNASQLDYVFPNLKSFAGTRLGTNLGFMAS